MKDLDTTTGAYVGLSVDYAQSLITNDGLKSKVVGSGKVIKEQNPGPYSTIPKEGTVILYTDNNPEIKQVTVPDFSNLSLAEVNQLAYEKGLNLCIKGSKVSEGGSYAKKQDIAAGTKVDPYTVVTVTFNQNNAIM